MPPPAQQTAAAAPPRLPPLALGGLPPRRVDLQPSSQTPTALSVDILSPAFNLQRQQQQDGDTSQLALTCAGRLGVQPERLRFYALTEVAGPQQLPPGCSRAAVEVVDSRKWGWVAPGTWGRGGGLAGRWRLQSAGLCSPLLHCINAEDLLQAPAGFQLLGQLS